jgi:hypothetical protein
MAAGAPNADLAPKTVRDEGMDEIPTPIPINRRKSDRLNKLWWSDDTPRFITTLPLAERKGVPPPVGETLFWL